MIKLGGKGKEFELNHFASKNFHVYMSEDIAQRGPNFFTENKSFKEGVKKLREGDDVGTTIA
jgi:hypothetical protein